MSTTRMPHGRQLGLDATMAINPIHLMVDGADLLLLQKLKSLAPLVDTLHLNRFEKDVMRWAIAEM